MSGGRVILPPFFIVDLALLEGLSEPSLNALTYANSGDSCVKLIVAATTALVLAATPAHAALSGFYDSAEQITTIFASSEIADAVRQAPIGAISNTGKRDDGANEWTIRVQECDLVVYLLPVPPNGPGKTTYEIDVPGTCE